MENKPQNLNKKGFEKKEGSIDFQSPIEKYKLIFSDILKRVSVLHQDFNKLKNNPNSLPFTERGIDFLHYLTETSEGPFIRNFMEDLEKTVKDEQGKNNIEKIKKLFIFISSLRVAQGIVWNFSENLNLFLNSMEMMEESSQKVSMIEEEDILRIFLFYKLSEILESNIKEMSEILEQNF